MKNRRVQHEKIVLLMTVMIAVFMFVGCNKNETDNKVPNNDQTQNIEMPKEKPLNERLETLKEEYAENAEILPILTNGENVKIKILNNIGVFVISTRADELIQSFDDGI